MPRIGTTPRLSTARRRLRARISARRRRCVGLVVRVAAPLHWLDAIEAWWRSLGPIGHVGGGLAMFSTWRWGRRSGRAGKDSGDPWWSKVVGWLLAQAEETTL
jgi:hypothetical protein